MAKMKKDRGNGKEPLKEIYGFVAGIKLMQIASYDHQLSPAALRILGILTGYMDVNGICWPSLSKVAENMGITKAAVTKQIRILEKHGYISTKTRSHPETGATMTNTYLLNLDMAREYQKTPNILCKYNHDLIVAYLGISLWHHVTFKSYPPHNPNLLPLSVTTESYSKKIDIENTNRKTPNIPQLTKEQSNAIQKANQWDQRKDFEEKTGITKEDEQRYSIICQSLREYMSPARMTLMDIELSKQTKGLPPKDGLKVKENALLEKIAEFQKIETSATKIN